MLLEQLRKDFVPGAQERSVSSTIARCAAAAAAAAGKGGNALPRQPRPMLELLLGHAQHAAEGFDVSLKLRHRVVDAVGAKIQLAQLLWQVVEQAVSSLQDGYQPNSNDADLRKRARNLKMYVLCHGLDLHDALSLHSEVGQVDIAIEIVPEIMSDGLVSSATNKAISTTLE